jgi:hypothetical protein
MTVRLAAHLAMAEHDVAQRADDLVAYCAAKATARRPRGRRRIVGIGHDGGVLVVHSSVYSARRLTLSRKTFLVIGGNDRRKSSLMRQPAAT